MTITTDQGMVGAALLLARLAVGLGLAPHGAQKLFGWFGGYGLAGTGGFFEGLGFRPGRPFALVAGLGELVGGLLLALGLFTPVGSALAIAVMTAAAVSVHWKEGFFAPKGIELPMIYATAAFLLAVTGPGLYSLDTLLGLESFWTPTVAWGALAVGLAGGVLNLLAPELRRPPTNPARAEPV
ncbi:MAG: DoxX family protein [Gemmatimonadota bacterium]|nr:DoxX family protein [Gemmatimonadota bacterium]